MHRRTRRLVSVVAAFMAAAAPRARAEPISVRTVEAVEQGPQTVVKIHLSAPLASTPRTRVIPKEGDQPDRIAVDLPGVDLHGKASREATVGWGGVRRIRLGMPSPDGARVVLELDRLVDFDLMTDGDVVNVTLGAQAPAAASDPKTPPPAPARPATIPPAASK